MTMKSSSGGGHVIGVPVTSKAHGIEEVSRDPSFGKGAGDHLAVSLTHPSPYASFGYKHTCLLTCFCSDAAGSKGQVTHWVSKLSRRAQGFREHVTLGPKLSETVKGKLSLGARILQAGGVERVFRQAFAAADKGERLLKALQCYIYTTGGPIAGMLFVSTRKVAFRSDRPITVTSPGPRGGTARVTYKVAIPLRRIRRVRPSENVHRPEEKYIHVSTVDGFEFWFMGFVSYQRSCKYMQQAVSEMR
ncbi:putative GEM-like protein 8 [Zea mays]|uniref:Putative GEM-like protein 8 n=1 Tax=Zea mays TaxID=4577 RepID=A0A3L6G7P3_MAIZE|nr:putative GEM-like protein 8 [Zea mays]